MTLQHKRVVVTGMGTVNCTGLTVEESWANVVAGRSGVGPITLFDHRECGVHFAGEVKNFDPAWYGLPIYYARWD